MEVSFEKGHLSGIKANLLCVFLMQDAKVPAELVQFLKVPKERYDGKLMQYVAADTNGKAGFGHILIIGLGKTGEYKAEFARRAAGMAVRYAAARKTKEVTLHMAGVPQKELAKSVQAAAEGAMLAGYKFYQYKTKREDLFEVENATVVMEKDFSDAVALGVVNAGAQNYARELDEQPANIATPSRVAEWAKTLAKDYGLGVTVFDKHALKKMGMNGILAVGKGSVEEPKLVKLEYNVGKKYPLYCIIGKGVTFDSGGISLKPSLNMHEMKYDKTGAINVLGVFRAVAERKLPIRLLGLMPLVENVPSGSAQLPGDIIKMYGGKTAEVLNTDAEGRLILADALAYAVEQKPEYIIDMATLTGAMVVCLGRHAIGIFSNDDALASALDEAGNDTHERVWRFPIWPEYGEMNKSDFADIKNISETGGEAGSITGAMFLKEFVGDVKWAHLDIAAVDCIKPPHPYMDKGASGIGVRLVTETLARLAAKKK